MEKKSLLFRLFALVVATMCALGIQAQEAYACYTPSNTTLTFYYDNQRDSRPGTTYDLSIYENQMGWYEIRQDVTNVVFTQSFADARPTSTERWFYQMSNLQSITGMEYLNTEEATNMNYMFYACTSLTSLDVTHLNTSNVTTMSFMFCYCNSLTNLDVSNFNTSNVTFMGGMFSFCSGLTSLDVSNFNTANVTNMSLMFCDCYSLTSLDLSNFNTANVAYMKSMFGSCNSLTSLDLSSFNTANVTNMSFMFYGCSDLATIYVGNGWTTAAVTNSDDMFTDCNNLVGGQGTTYNANYIDKTYAHIDGGTTNPGYFTYKNASLLGDVTGEGDVDVSDVNAVINIILHKKTQADYPGNADVTGEGNIDVSDVNAIINIILHKN